MALAWGFWVRSLRLVRALVIVCAALLVLGVLGCGLYILILHGLLIYTYTHGIYNILDIIYII